MLVFVDVSMQPWVLNSEKAQIIYNLCGSGLLWCIWCYLTRLKTLSCESFQCWPDDPPASWLRKSDIRGGPTRHYFLRREKCSYDMKPVLDNQNVLIETVIFLFPCASRQITKMDCVIALHGLFAKFLVCSLPSFIVLSIVNLHIPYIALLCLRLRLVYFIADQILRQCIRTCPERNAE